MVSFAVRHVSDAASVRGVLASRRKGAAGGLVVPTRLHFGMATSYLKSLGDGSTPSKVDVVFPDAKYTALEADPAWTGHRFLGWRDVVGALPNVAGTVTGNAVLASAWVPYGLHTVHAQWQTPASVTFDATTNGGSMPAGWSAPYYYVGQPYGTLPAPTHPTLNFSGWFLNGSRVTSASTVANGVPLVAQYTSSYYEADLSGYDGGTGWTSSSSPIPYTYWEESERYDEEMDDWVWESNEVSTSFTPPSNPDSTAYDGVYTALNGAAEDCTAWMKVSVLGYTSFRVLIASAGSGDTWSHFTVALEADETPEGLPSGWELSEQGAVKASTYGEYGYDGSGVAGYLAVDYSLDGGPHDIWIGATRGWHEYSSDDSRWGLVLIPKVQGGNA